MCESIRGELAFPNEMALSLSDEDKFASIEMLLFYPEIWDFSVERYLNKNRARESYISRLLHVKWALCDG